MAGCASQPISPDARTRIQSVGVVSLIDDEIQMVRIGTMVFGNKFHSLPAGHLGLNEVVERAIATNLRIGKPTLLSKEREGIRRVAGKSKGERFWSAGSINSRLILAEAQRLHRAHGIDTLVAVVPGTTTPYNSNATLTGFSIYQRSAFGMGSTAAFAVQSIMVIDARAGTLLRQRMAVAATEIPEETWRKDAAADEFRAPLVEAIEKAIPGTLHGLGLGDAPPQR
jgi:hypothetical protein